MSMLANLAAAIFAAFLGYFAHDLVSTGPAAPQALGAMEIRLQLAPVVMPTDIEHRFAVASRAISMEATVVTRKDRGIFTPVFSVRRNPGPLSAVSGRNDPMSLANEQSFVMTRSITILASNDRMPAFRPAGNSPRAQESDTILR